MKGILYSFFAKKRSYFTGALIYCAAACALGFAALLLPDNILHNNGFNTLTIIIPLILLMIPEESVLSDLDGDIKSRYADYVLTAVTRETFARGMLIKNLICIAAGLALSMIVAATYYLIGIADSTIFVQLPAMAAICGAVEWTCTPLTVRMKSAEKAGMTVGLIIGFVIVLPLLIAVNVFADEDSTLYMSVINWLTGAQVLIPTFIISAAVYAGFYFILLNRLERGNVC